MLFVVSMGASEIILVEDDANVTRLVSHQLKRVGYRVHCAGLVREARDLSRAVDWDIAVLDRNLPDGNGIELCYELRAARPYAYIVLLTGESSDAAKLEGFACGADDYITKPFQLDELIARLRAGERIVGLQKALLASNQQLEELSLTASLTSLRNRRAFDQELQPAFERARRYDRPLSLAMLDIDHFKSINDTYGHATGDAVLRNVARLIAAETRQSDFVARVGGEEFGILLPEIPLFESMQFAEKIRATIASTPIDFGEQTHRVTVSIGIANASHSRVRTAAELIDAADQALYRAKANGRNRVEMERRQDTRREGPPRIELRASRSSN